MSWTLKQRWAAWSPMEPSTSLASFGCSAILALCLLCRVRQQVNGSIFPLSLRTHLYKKPCHNNPSYPPVKMLPAQEKTRACTKKTKQPPRAHQFSSVAQSCPTLCDPMNRSTPGLPVHHQLLKFTQTQVHQVGDAIQPSHPLSSPSPPAPNPSQHQSLPMSQLFA